MKSKSKLLVVLLALAMIVTMVAGCSTPGGGGGGSTDGGGDDSGEVVVRAVLTADPSSLDPGFGNSSDSTSPRGVMYEGLVRIYDNVLSPAMAESWDVADDGMTYTFHLRDSKWSDGQPVTAYDFEYGFKRLMSQEEDAPKGNYQWIGEAIYNGYEVESGQVPVDELGVKAIDDKTLEVKSAGIMPYFVDILKTPVFYPVREDIVEKVGNDYGSSPENSISCGPFTLVEWEHESKLVFEKNPGYWNADNINVDKLEIYIIQDSGTIMNMFDAGELDMMPSVTKEFIQKYIDTGEAIQMDGATIQYIAVNTKTEREASKLLQNKNFRQALSYLINREDIVAAARGDGSKAVSRLLPTNITTAYNNEFMGDAYPYEPYPLTGDVEKAKELFAKALEETGYTADTLPALTLVTYDEDPAKKIAEVVQDNCATEFGLTINIDTQTYGARQEKEHAGDYDLCVTNWAPDYNDPINFLECYASTNSYNTYFGGLQNAEVDALVASIKANTDFKSRADDMFKCEQIICEELPVIPLWQTAGYWAMKPYVTGITKCGFGANDPDYAQVHYIGE